jgi:hypothetical protein
MTLTELNALIGKITLPNFAFSVLDADASQFRIIVSLIDKDGNGVLGAVFTADFTWTRSQIVKTIFAQVQEIIGGQLAANFKYRGRPIFTQTYDVDRLWDICAVENMDKKA